MSGFRSKFTKATSFDVFKVDAQYEDMFENGNYRRRRRMKRPYRTGAHFSKMFADPYGNANFGHRTVFAQAPYQGYPRYEAGWMAPTQLTTYPPCPSRTSYSYASPIQQTSVPPVTINSYGNMGNGLGKDRRWLV